MTINTPDGDRLDADMENRADFVEHVPHAGGALVTETGNNESLTVEVDPQGVIVVHGDIDIAGGPILETVILARESGEQIVLDLGDVFFIDSSGLRSLLGASRRAQARNTTVVLRAVGPEVARLLQITGTTDQFTIESSRD